MKEKFTLQEVMDSANQLAEMMQITKPAAIMAILKYQQNKIMIQQSAILSVGIDKIAEKLDAIIKTHETVLNN